jgi:hypothetical protein
VFQALHAVAVDSDAAPPFAADDAQVERSKPSTRRPKFLRGSSVETAST